MASDTDKPWTNLSRPRPVVAPNRRLVRWWRSTSARQRAAACPVLLFALLLLLVPAFRRSTAARGNVLTAASGLVAALEHQAAWTASSLFDGHNPYMAICLAVKDQHDVMVEWVEHHRSVGVGKIYIFDTGSSPSLNITLSRAISDGSVEYIPYKADFGSRVNATSRRYPQMQMYKECLQRYGSRHQFIGFLDSDEYLILKDGSASIVHILHRMMAVEPIGALVVNWRVFGSSGHVKKPNGGVLKNYWQCVPLGRNGHSRHIKSIVNTQLVNLDKLVDPHQFRYLHGAYAVNEHFQRTDGVQVHTASDDHVVINHYLLKSWQEFKDKVQRGSAMGNHKSMALFREINAAATEKCTELTESSLGARL